MMGEIDAQGNLFTGDQVHLDHVGRDTFYGWLAQEGPRVFPDSDFKKLYVLDNGRKSIPPSQLMRMVLLQWYEGTSDKETVERAKFDLRWKVALGLEDHEGLCAKFTLQMFRGRLLLNELGRELLARSARVCREAGVIRSPKVRAALDTSPIIGRGAVKDTYNLVADGIVKLLRALSAFETPLLQAVDVPGYAASLDLSRYFSDTSLKGGASLDWNEESERVAFLNELVADVRRAQRAAEAALAAADPARDSMRCAKRSEVREALSLLGQLVEQDIEIQEDGAARIKKGVAKDRVISVHDPEMRHGRKSARNRFDGHKGEIVVDADSGVILDTSVKAGNAHDADGSIEAIDRAEKTLRAAFAGAPAGGFPEADEVTAESGGGEGSGESGPPEIEVALGDCAYGTAQNRREFADAERELIAKQATLHNRGRFTKEDFPVDGESGARTCPAGHTAPPRQRTRDWNGEKVKVNVYTWPTGVCAACPLREQCLGPKEEDTPPRTTGRSVSEHPEEALLAKARARQQTPAFKESYRERQTVEHRLARMMQLGARQARYFGRAKTQLQWFLAATVANLTLAIAGGAGKEAPETHPSIPNQLLQRLIGWLRTHDRRISIQHPQTPTPAPVPIHANA